MHCNLPRAVLTVRAAGPCDRDSFSPATRFDGHRRARPRFGVDPVRGHLTTISQWINSIEVLATSGIYVVWPDRPGFPSPYAGPYSGDGYDLNTTYTPEIALAHDTAALVRRLNLLLCAGQLSSDTQARIVAMLNDGATLTVASTPADKRWRVSAAVSLVMCSPEYIVQK